MGNYIDITYANAYIDQNPYIGARWSGLTDPQKDYFILYAEQLIDNINWLGEAVSSTQPGDFPRDITEIKDDDRWDTLSDNLQRRYEEFNGVIPDVLRDAACEVIIYVLRTDKFDKLVALQEINVDNFSAGSVSFDFDLERGFPPLPKQAWKLLAFMSVSAWNRQAPVWMDRV